MHTNFSASELRQAQYTELNGLFSIIGKGIKKIYKGGKAVFKAGRDYGTLQQQANASYTGTGGVALTQEELALYNQAIAKSSGASGSKPLPNWIVPAAIGGGALLLILSMKK